MTLGVVDRIALRDLVARYALLTDRRDTAALTGLFAEDAVLRLPDPPDRLDPVREFAGHGEIGGSFAALDAVPVTFHALAGEVFDAGPEPGTATGEVACVAHHITEREPGKAADLVWCLRYADAYRLDGDTWRITRRELRIDSIETRPVRRWRGAE